MPHGPLERVVRCHAYSTGLGSSVVDCHSALSPCQIRSSAACSVSFSPEYAFAACRAMSTRRMPQAAGSLHVVLSEYCCGMFGPPQTRNISWAPACFEIGGGSSSLFGPRKNPTCLLLELRRAPKRIHVTPNDRVEGPTTLPIAACRNSQQPVGIQCAAHNRPRSAPTRC